MMKAKDRALAHGTVLPTRQKVFGLFYYKNNYLFKNFSQILKMIKDIYVNNELLKKNIRGVRL